MRTTKRRRGGTSATQLLCGASHGAQFVGGSDADGAMPGQTMPTVPCLLCRNIIWVIIWPFFVFAVSHLLCTASSPPYFISYSVYWIIRANPATCRSPDEGAIEPSTGLTRERCHFLTFSIYRGHRAGARESSGYWLDGSDRRDRILAGARESSGYWLTGRVGSNLLEVCLFLVIFCLQWGYVLLMGLGYFCN